MKKSKLPVLIMVFVLAFGIVLGSAMAEASVTLEPHKYAPIAPTHSVNTQPSGAAGTQEETQGTESAEVSPEIPASEREDRSTNICADPLHQSDPVCGLISWNNKGAGEWTAKTAATVRDVKLTTTEMAKRLKKNDLQAYIIKKAKAQFRNMETNTLLNNIYVVSVSDLNVLRHLSLSAGSVSLTVALGLSPQEGGKAEAYIQTRIHLVHEAEKTKSSSSSEDPSDDDYGEDIDTDDNNYDALAKQRAAAKKAKEKAEKERLKKLTAQITPKEREKDTDVAMAADEPTPVREGPSTEGILLLMAATALAAVFGWLIRSDLRVMRWYRQKKALRKH